MPHAYAPQVYARLAHYDSARLDAPWSIAVMHYWTTDVLAEMSSAGSAAYKRKDGITRQPIFHDFSVRNCLPPVLCAMPIPATLSPSLSVVREVLSTAQPSSGSGYVQSRS